MQRAQKIVLTVISIAALSTVLSACGMSEQGDSVDGIDPTPYGSKVTICHHTTSRTSPAHVIEVSVSSLSAHLAHGDTVGATCDAVEPPNPPLPDAGPAGEPDAEVMPG